MWPQSTWWAAGASCILQREGHGAVSSHLLTPPAPQLVAYTSSFYEGPSPAQLAGCSSSHLHTAGNLGQLARLWYFQTLLPGPWQPHCPIIFAQERAATEEMLGEAPGRTQQ